MQHESSRFFLLQPRPTGTRPWGRPSVSSTLSHEFFDVKEFDDENQVWTFFRTNFFLPESKTIQLFASKKVIAKVNIFFNKKRGWGIEEYKRVPYII